MVRSRVAARLSATGSGTDVTVSARASSRWRTQSAGWVSSRTRKGAQSVAWAVDVVAAGVVTEAMGVLLGRRETRSTGADRARTRAEDPQGVRHPPAAPGPDCAAARPARAGHAPAGSSPGPAARHR